MAAIDKRPILNMMLALARRRGVDISTRGRGIALAARKRPGREAILRRKAAVGRVLEDAFAEEPGKVLITVDRLSRVHMVYEQLQRIAPHLSIAWLGVSAEQIEDLAESHGDVFDLRKFVAVDKATEIAFFERLHALVLRLQNRLSGAMHDGFNLFDYISGTMVSKGALGFREDVVLENLFEERGFDCVVLVNRGVDLHTLAAVRLGALHADTSLFFSETAVRLDRSGASAHYGPFGQIEDASDLFRRPERPVLEMAGLSIRERLRRSLRLLRDDPATWARNSRKSLARGGALLRAVLARRLERLRTLADRGLPAVLLAIYYRFRRVARIFTRHLPRLVQRYWRALWRALRREFEEALVPFEIRVHLFLQKLPWLLQKLPWLLQKLPWFGFRRDLRDPVVVVAEAVPGSVYWRALNELIRAMAARDVPCVVLTTKRDTAKKMSRAGVISFQLPNTKPNFEAHGVRGAIQSLREQLDQPWDDPVEAAIVRGLADSEQMERAVARGLRVGTAFAALFEECRPRSVFVMPQSSDLADQVRPAARRAGIPVISSPPVTIAPHRRSVPWWDADFICCYGRQCTEAFTTLGFDPRRLLLTGNPAFDDLVRSLGPTPERVGSSNKRVILIATSRIDPEEPVWIERLVEHCLARGDTRVVAKAHPSYSASDYELPSGNPGPDLYEVVEGTPIPDLLRIADVVVTDYSTVGTEAGLVGRPMLVVNLLGKPYPSNNYDRMGIALLVERLDEMGSKLDSVLNDPETLARFRSAHDAFCMDYNGPNDGAAAERICDVLCDPPPAISDAVEEQRAAG
jgi:hypothetical protein